MYLAGDIGGTKTVLALFARESGPHRPLFQRRYSSTEFSSLVDIVADFMNSNNVAPMAATFGVAGPVREGKVRVA